MKSQELAVVLVSGGMDSLVCAAIAASKHEHLAFLHLNYGQRTEKKELESFHAIADFYNVPKNMRKIIDVSFLKQIGSLWLPAISQRAKPCNSYQKS